MSYPATEASKAPQVADNGSGPPFRPIIPPTPSDPTHVRYRGVVRRVYGVVPARHQGHKHYACTTSGATRRSTHIRQSWGREARRATSRSSCGRIMRSR